MTKTCFTYVYISALSDCKVRSVFPVERDQEITSCTNPTQQKQKYIAWKLLEFGIKNSLNKDINNFSFTKLDSGKWVSNEIEFSITNSKDLVAVAISSSPIGVDVEEINEKILKASDKILDKSEMEVFSSLSNEDKIDFLTRKWTIKESALKCLNLKSLFTTNLCLQKDQTFSQALILNDRHYVLSTYGPTAPQTQIFFVDSSEF